MLRTLYNAVNDWDICQTGKESFAVLKAAVFVMYSQTPDTNPFSQGNLPDRTCCNPGEYQRGA